MFIYQGMSDGLHALVFSDNHDNQRSNPDSVLTHKEDYTYKLGVSFLLAQPYGFKRVMSSYYFDNKDQGPPGSQPGSFHENSCYNNGWVCEHRWSTTMNMVQVSSLYSMKQRFVLKAAYILVCQCLCWRTFAKLASKGRLSGI